MFNTIKKYLGFSPQYLSEVKQSDEVRSFVLSYKQKDVGYLEYRDNKWIYRYSDWFKSQDKFVPLIEFPDKEKVYQSTELWPFFASRIPSKINRGDSVDSEDDHSSLADLLQDFGRETINNPLVLEPN